MIYKDLIDRLGKKTAQIYGKSNQAALEQVERIIRLEKIDCDWQKDDNYVFTTKAKTVASLKAEAKAAADLGLPASFVTESGLPFDIKGAVKFTNQGKFHSQKYLLALAKLVHGGGSFIFEKSNVIGIRDGTPCHVRTRHGSVTAKHTVVATSVPTLPLFARGEYCMFEYPTQSYIVAGILEKPIRGMYISPDKDHYSILPFDLNGDHMILIGGGGNLAGFRLSKQNKFKRLAKYGAAKFDMPDVRYAWSDRDYMGYDSIPLVGKLYPWSKATYVASAYGKWGLTNSMVAASIIRDYICKIENTWAYEFEPHRMRAVRSFPRAVWKQISS
jgi:glycine/D-amino acid oxidase-like deaminating enzyme